MMGIGQVAKKLDVSENQIRGWLQRGQWNFPQPELCNCRRHLLWDEMAVQRWKIKRLAHALKHRQPNQWTIDNGLHLT